MKSAIRSHKDTDGCTAYSNNLKFIILLRSLEHTRYSVYVGLEYVYYARYIAEGLKSENGSYDTSVPGISEIYTTCPKIVFQKSPLYHDRPQAAKPLGRRRPDNAAGLEHVTKSIYIHTHTYTYTYTHIHTCIHVMMYHTHRQRQRSSINQGSMMGVSAFAFFTTCNFLRLPPSLFCFSFHSCFPLLLSFFLFLAPDSLLSLLELQSPFGDNWGQITWNWSALSPKRDWSSKGVNSCLWVVNLLIC